MTLAQRGWDMSVISNSETSMFQTCERKHFYGFGLRLQPKRMSAGLTRGIIGHEVLESYYTHLIEGEEPSEARTKAMVVFDVYFAKALTSGREDDTLLLMQLKRRITDYLESHESDASAWEILQTEQEYRITMPSGIDYAMRLDLLVRPRSGPFAGKTILVDHKFVWDFYREDAVTMNPQMPKYLGILHANGLNVHHAILNQIRTRVNKTKPMEAADKFRRSEVTPTPVEIKNIFAEELIVATRIEELRQLSPEEWEGKITRTMGQMTCGMCPFVSLCKSDLLGQDTRLQKQMDFEQSSYGYEAKK